jgi:glucose-1-phosphate cytidylyltransferase
MKVAILAGGRGTRLADPTDTHGIVPKPMVRIGEQPILWHILKHYEKYGFNDFTIACGFMSETIKEYFSNYSQQNAHMRFDLAHQTSQQIAAEIEDWIVTCVDTGEDTNTGGRIKRLQPFLADENGKNETFMLTWGDGLSDLNLGELLAFHREHGKLCTLTAVRPPARFGELTLQGDQITDFQEKPIQSQGWINGAFFVCEPEVFEYIEGDDTLFEGEPLQRLAKDGELMAYKYDGFWKCMDTPKDRDEIREMWNSGNAPWKEN